jgi:hypothetical protein
MAWDSALESTDPEPIGDIVSALAKDIPPSLQRVQFSNPDIDCLTRCYELEPRFIGRMLRIFGESITLETLRRFEKGWTESVFVGIARNVERNNG